MLFYKQHVVIIIENFVYLKIGKVGGKIERVGLNLGTVQNFDAGLCSMIEQTSNVWLIEFVQEVCDKNGKSCPQWVQTIPNYVLLEPTPGENGLAEVNERVVFKQPLVDSYDGVKIDWFTIDKEVQQSSVAGYLGSSNSTLTTVF